MSVRKKRKKERKHGTLKCETAKFTHRLKLPYFNFFLFSSPHLHFPLSSVVHYAPKHTHTPTRTRTQYCAQKFSLTLYSFEKIIILRFVFFWKKNQIVFFISIFVLGVFLYYHYFLFFIFRREMFITYVVIPYRSSRFEPFKSPLSLDPNVPFRVFFF